jgi:preprotein translocase subunit YajC
MAEVQSVMDAFDGWVTLLDALRQNAKWMGSSNRMSDNMSMGDTCILKSGIRESSP